MPIAVVGEKDLRLTLLVDPACAADGEELRDGGLATDGETALAAAPDPARAIEARPPARGARSG